MHFAVPEAHPRRGGATGGGGGWKKRLVLMRMKSAAIILRESRCLPESAKGMRGEIKLGAIPLNSFTIFKHRC